MDDQLDERGFLIAYINKQVKFYMESYGHSEMTARVIAEAMYNFDVDIIRILKSVKETRPISPPYDGSQRRRRYWKKVKFNGS